MGIFSKLFRSKKESRISSYKDAVKIVADFGRLIEIAPPPTGLVADVNELPHPKSDIKKALLIVLLTVDDETTKKQLFEAYYSLASWQSGVGEKRIGVDFANMPSGADEQGFQNVINSFTSDYEEWKKWEPVVEREQSELLAELAALGFK